MPEPTLIVQAEFAAELPDPERRMAERHFLDHKLPTCLLTRPGLEYLNAVVENVSAHGLRLLVDRCLDPGTVMAVRLKGGPRSAIQSARVVYARPRTASEWAIGCKLATPLSGSELEALLDDRS